VQKWEKKKLIREYVRGQGGRAKGDVRSGAERTAKEKRGWGTHAWAKNPIGEWKPEPKTKRGENVKKMTKRNKQKMSATEFRG